MGKWTGRTRAIAALAVLSTTAGLGACSRDGGDAAAIRESSATSSNFSTGGGEGQVADTAEAAGAPLPQGLGAAKVVKTASIEVEVAEGAFDAAFSKVATIAAAHGGFIASSTSRQGSASDDRHRQAAGSLVVRIPAEQFDAARTQLIELGELRSQQLAGDDVTGRLTDLDARLRNLRSQEEAIRLLMTKATTIGETIEVQRQLGTVREQIEQLSGEQARLGDAVALSTITLSLAEPGVATKADADRSTLGEAIHRAVDGAADVLAAVIVALGYFIPLALLLALAWLVARPFVGRRTVNPT
jgi:hypothetical protein